MTTFIGGDGQSAYEQDSTFNGVAVPSANWDGRDPQAGPDYSNGNLWDTRTVDVSSLVAPGSTAATATVDGANDCHVWIAQVLSVSGVGAPPPQSPVAQVIFVHGIGADSTKPGFNDLLGPLQALARSYRATYSNFDYVQDVADGGDSNSSMGDNANLLYQKILDSYNTTHGKTVLVANSMGGAIVRGVLAKLGPSGAGMIDGVFFIEGAQSGSWLLYADAGTRDIPGWANPLIWGLRQGITQMSAVKLDRPAVVDLTPRSAWYRSVNPAPIPDVPYFNAYGDITASIGVCVFVCVAVGDLEMGDPLLLPGNPDPHSLDPLGGARFLPNPPDANHGEYRLSASVTYNLAALAASPAFFASDVLNNPVSHFQLNGKIGQVTVRHCGSGQQVSLANEYLNIISRRLGGFAQSCDPADMTIHQGGANP